MKKLCIAVDLAGCPNRCRHCWLGHFKNGKLGIEEFKQVAEIFTSWKKENDCSELAFFSWWREPDFSDNYKRLWELEQELSSPNCAERFELLSVWRASFDLEYARWAAKLKPKVCQITFFGAEQKTDWGFGRKGAFANNLAAVENLLKVGIAPRFQIFLTKGCFGNRSLDLDKLLKLIYSRELHKRCEAIGQKFEVFISGMAPEGAAYDIEDYRIEESDIKLIPQSLIDISREGTKLLGEPEYILHKRLLANNSPPNLITNPPCLYITCNYDVYPNYASPGKAWLLGNLKTDGIEFVMNNFINENTVAMQTNKTMPISRLAQQYGMAESKKMYGDDSLVARYLYQHLNQ